MHWQKKKVSKVSALEQSLYKSHCREYFWEQMPLIPFSYYWVRFHTIGLRDMHMEIIFHLRVHMEITIYLSSRFRTIGLRDTERDTEDRASPLPPGSPRLRAWKRKFSKVRALVQFLKRSPLQRVHLRTDAMNESLALIKNKKINKITMESTMSESLALSSSSSSSSIAEGEAPSDEGWGRGKKKFWNSVPQYPYFYYI